MWMKNFAICSRFLAAEMAALFIGPLGGPHFVPLTPALSLRERAGVRGTKCGPPNGPMNNAAISAAKNREQMAKFFIHILPRGHGVRDFGSQCLPIVLSKAVDIRLERPCGQAELTRRFDIAQAALFARQKLFHDLEPVGPALGRILL